MISLEKSDRLRDITAVMELISCLSFKGVFQISQTHPAEEGRCLNPDFACLLLHSIFSPRNI